MDDESVTPNRQEQEPIPIYAPGHESDTDYDHRQETSHSQGTYPFYSTSTYSNQGTYWPTQPQFYAQSFIPIQIQESPNEFRSESNHDQVNQFHNSLNVHEQHGQAAPHDHLTDGSQSQLYHNRATQFLKSINNHQAEQSTLYDYITQTLQPGHIDPTMQTPQHSGSGPYHDYPPNSITETPLLPSTRHRRVNQTPDPLAEPELVIPNQSSSIIRARRNPRQSRADNRAENANQTPVPLAEPELVIPNKSSSIIRARRNPRQSRADNRAENQFHPYQEVQPLRISRTRNANRAACGTEQTHRPQPPLVGDDTTPRPSSRQSSRMDIDESDDHSHKTTRPANVQPPVLPQQHQTPHVAQSVQSRPKPSTSQKRPESHHQNQHSQSGLSSRKPILHKMEKESHRKPHPRSPSRKVHTEHRSVPMDEDMDENENDRKSYKDENEEAENDYKGYKDEDEEMNEDVDDFDGDKQEEDIDDFDGDKQEEDIDDIDGDEEEEDIEDEEMDEDIDDFDGDEEEEEIDDIDGDEEGEDIEFSDGDGDEEEEAQFNLNEDEKTDHTANAEDKDPGADPDKDHHSNDAEDPDSDSGLEEKSAEDEAESEIDMFEQNSYRNKKHKRNQKHTHNRQSDRRLEKLSRGRDAPSQYDPLSIAVGDYIKFLMGIARKRRGQNSINSSIPEPPTAAEVNSWVVRKTKRRDLIEKHVAKSKLAYLEKHPKATSSQLAAVEEEAVEKVLSKIHPVKFVSQVLHTASGVKYSSSVASTCEASLALSGFPRCTFDWNSNVKGDWNEGISSIILQEWEKCHKRGDADSYLVNPNLVTSKNIRGVFERWFATKKREYMIQCHNSTATTPGNSSQETSKPTPRDIAAQRNARKQVCSIRTSVFSRHFKKFSEYHDVLCLIEGKSVHSEDEFDSNQTRQRKSIHWLHPDFPKLLHHLDDIYTHEQLDLRSQTIAKRALDRGAHVEMEPEEKKFCNPPQGFPQCLVEVSYYKNISEARKSKLQLSSRNVRLGPLIKHARSLCS